MKRVLDLAAISVVCGTAYEDDSLDTHQRFVSLYGMDYVLPRVRMGSSPLRDYSIPQVPSLTEITFETENCFSA